MKDTTLSAVLFGLAALNAGADASTVQPSCPAAPAVTGTYLRDQVAGGKKLTMSRAAIIADVTKNTGADGEFAGVKPCDPRCLAIGGPSRSYRGELRSR